MRIKLLLSLILGVAIASSTPTIASACMNAVELDSNQVARLIKRAEKAVERGNYKQALRILEKDYELAPSLSEPVPGLYRRTVLVSAAVAFRVSYLEDVDYYVRQLENLLENDKSPEIHTLLAEGYALNPETMGKASDILEDLAERDLMPNAFAFLTLARLRAQAGDDVGAKEGLQSCRSMAKHKRLCKIKTKKKTQYRRPSKKAKLRTRG